MAKKKLVPAAITELDSTEQNIHNAESAELKHNQVEITTNIDVDSVEENDYRPCRKKELFLFFCL